LEQQHEAVSYSGRSSPVCVPRERYPQGLLRFNDVFERMPAEIERKFEAAASSIATTQEEWLRSALLLAAIAATKCTRRLVAGKTTCVVVGCGGMKRWRLATTQAGRNRAADRRRYATQL